MAIPLAQRLADYAGSLRFEDLPAAVVHEAKRRFIDSFGTAVGAMDADAHAIARRCALRVQGNPGAGLFGGDSAAFEQQNEAFLKNAAGVNKSVKLLEITVGDKDFAQAGSKALAGVFEKHGIKHELTITGGGHTWINWRQYLNELAPKLFQ